MIEEEKKGYDTADWQRRNGNGSDLQMISTICGVPIGNGINNQYLLQPAQYAISFTDRGAAAGGQSSMRLTTMDNYSACNMTILNDEVPNSNDI